MEKYPYGEGMTTIYNTTGPPIVNQMSDFQKVTVADLPGFGRSLWIDDVPNVTEKDEFIYHEMIVHVPMMMHPDPRRVLIVGGGDGASARELLKHPNLERAVMVDIDGLVVESCRKHMPQFNNGAFDDPRLELIIGDGIEMVRKSAYESWDVIIVDSTDPVPDGAGEVLFGAEFYEECHRSLAKNGVLSTLGNLPMMCEKEDFANCFSRCQDSFSKERAWLYLVPTDFYGGQTSFGCCFKGDVHPLKIDKTRVDAFTKQHKLKYYRHKVHKAAFSLPPYLLDTIGSTSGK
jgi:spermidine synthase